MKQPIKRFYNEQGELAVLIWSNTQYPEGLYDPEKEDHDYLINIDKRLIEYFNLGCHTYKEWDAKFKECGYTFSFYDIFSRSYDHRKEPPYYDGNVADEFYVEYVPKGWYFMISTDNCYDSYGELEGFVQSLDCFDPKYMWKNV